MALSANGAINAMTVDVEDWFQVQAFAGIIPRDDWDGLDRRVEANTDRVLAQFAAHKVTGTFFTLGWVAERHPALVRRIVDAGHELASHGHGHQRVDEIGESAFRDDIVRAKAVLEDVGGVAVSGYRAPTFSIGPRTPWAYPTLRDAGYRYSSSVFPIRHDLYGAPDAPTVPYRPPGAPTLWEIPMTVARVFGRNVPCSGGGWFRLAPYALFRTGLSAVNAEKRAGLFYFHPWEVDPGQPDVPQAPWRSRFRHRVNLSRMTGRLDRLLGDFSWDRMDRVFAREFATAAGGAAS